MRARRRGRFACPCRLEEREAVEVGSAEVVAWTVAAFVCLILSEKVDRAIATGRSRASGRDDTQHTPSSLVHRGAPPAPSEPLSSVPRHVHSVPHIHIHLTLTSIDRTARPPRRETAPFTFVARYAVPHSSHAPCKEEKKRRRMPCNLLGADLCGPGGKCLARSGAGSGNTTKICVCPPGAVFDNSIFHTQNCIDPLVYIVFLAMSAAIGIPLMVALAYEAAEAQGVLRSVLLKLVTQFAMLLGVALSIFFQQGFYVGAAVFLPPSLCLSFLIALDIWTMTITPVYAMAQMPMDRMVRLFNVARFVSITANTLGIIPVAVLSVTDVAGFNVFLVISLMFSFASLCFGVFGAVINARRLDRVLEGITAGLDFRSPHYHDVESLRSRMKQITYLASPVIVVLFTTFLPFPLMWLISGGYAPYQFLMLFSTQVGYLFLGLIGFALVRKSRRKVPISMGFPYSPQQPVVVRGGFS